MMPFALLVVGAMQRKEFAALSVLIYLAVGALGAPIYAGGESGWHHLVGHTAGYLWGFVAAAWLVSWYVERRRRMLDGRTASVAAIALGGLGLFAIVSLTWIALRGGTFLPADEATGASGWSSTQSLLWLCIAMAGLLAAGIAAWSLTQRGQGLERFNLFLVMLAAIAVIHIPGVIVLQAMTPLGWSQAIALGSTVFLPFDLVKAGAATAMAAVFLPTREEMPDV
jgi:biotin transporter BioY